MLEINNIETSLRHGRLFTGRVLAFFHTILAVEILYIVVLIISAVFMTISGIYWYMSILICLGFFILPGAFLIVILIMLNRNNKLKKQIILWMEDAVLTKAVSKTLDKFKVIGQLLDEIKIEVRFCVNGKHYTQVSGDGGKRSKMYQKIYSKYSDREIHILYSPKYDEVLILKENKNQ